MERPMSHDPNRRITSFVTHTGEVVKGERLVKALGDVADDWAALSRRIRASADYAAHVSEAERDRLLADGLARAESIRQGEVGSFTIAQRLNEKLTGECVALL
jgi:hypothetical protein